MWDEMKQPRTTPRLSKDDAVEAWQAPEDALPRERPDADDVFVSQSKVVLQRVEERRLIYDANEGMGTHKPPYNTRAMLEAGIRSCAPAKRQARP